MVAIRGNMTSYISLAQALHSMHAFTVQRRISIAFIPSANYKTIYFTDFLLKFQMQEVCTANDYNYKKKNLHELKKASHIKYISTQKKTKKF